MMDGAMAGLDLSIMLSSATVLMVTKIVLLMFALVLIHLLLGWMDNRSDGGFNAWRRLVLDVVAAGKAGKDSDGVSYNVVLVVLGLYYIARFSTLYICVAMLFSS